VYLINSPSGDELPKKGFDVGDNGFQAPATDGSTVKIAVDESSDRLQLLEPFLSMGRKNITGAKPLIKAFETKNY
jgi:aconitate hydratase